jgi:polysaccharide biosynthesis protein PslH
MLSHYLWLTLCDPDPQTNGELIYSGGLIWAVANTGARLTVLGLSQQPGSNPGRKEPNMDWPFAEDRRLSRWARVTSRLPSLAMRTNVPDMRAALASHLAHGKWDALVLDSFSVGWALPHLLRYRRRHLQTKIAYLAENHENDRRPSRGTRRKRLAANVPARRGGKTEWLERRLAQGADLVTADSPEDCRELEAMCPEKAVAFLLPGYAGPRVAARTIGRAGASVFLRSR